MQMQSRIKIVKHCKHLNNNINGYNQNLSVYMQCESGS